MRVMLLCSLLAFCFPMAALAQGKVHSKDKGKDVPSTATRTVRTKAASRNWDLHEAAKAGDLNKVKQLLQQGANVNAQDINGSTPLHLAADFGYLEIVRELIMHGANIEMRGGILNSTPLHDAAFSGHLNVVRELLNRGAATEI